MHAVLKLSSLIIVVDSVCHQLCSKWAASFECSVNWNLFDVCMAFKQSCLIIIS